MTHGLQARLGQILTLAALGLLGCAGQSDFMAKVPDGTPPVAPVADSATVVFVRDSGLAFIVNFAIVDQAGNLLGDAVARSHFALQLAPGRYYFFARSPENSDVIRADVAAGYLYHVRVVARFGAFAARVGLDPIKPGEREWSSLPDWLAQTNHLRPLIARAPASVSDATLPDWVAKAWSSRSSSDQLEHTLAPTDGRSTSAATPQKSAEPISGFGL